MVEFIPMIRGAIRPHILTRIATIFFETGLIYSLSVVLSLGIYLTRSNLEYVVSLAVRPFICSRKCTCSCISDDPYNCELYH